MPETPLPDCPCCQTGDPTQVLAGERVPVHQNRVYRSPQAARGATTGELQLLCCEACGHVWNGAFNADLLSYGEDYDNRQDVSPAFSDYLDAIVDRLGSDLGEESAIVEVGCGQGRFLQRLCARTGALGTGFDPAYGGPESQGDLRFVRAFYGPEQADTPADLVVCRHVIEHVPEAADLLTSVRQALRGRPAARVFFECPDMRWILEHDVVWDVFYEHVHYFSPASLRALFHRCGFEDVRIQTAFAGQYLWVDARPGLASSLCMTSWTLPAVLAWARDRSERIAAWRSSLRGLAEGGPVFIWGAGAKGVTLANLVDPDSACVAGLVDVNPGKWGAFVAGSGHPILAPSELSRFASPRVVVVNPNYLGEVRAQVDAMDLDAEVWGPEILGAPVSATASRASVR